MTVGIGKSGVDRVSVVVKKLVVVDKIHTDVDRDEQDIDGFSVDIGAVSITVGIGASEQDIAGAVSVTVSVELSELVAVLSTMMHGNRNRRMRLYAAKSNDKPGSLSTHTTSGEALLGSATVQH